jgi:phenylpropionate dioxygenase-like ring-hydroxylating dioxygenase large terminal subunit
MAPTFLNYLGLRGTSTETVEADESTAVRALPAPWYTTEEIYELERRAIFSRKWLLITHKNRLKNAGDWLRYEIAGFDVVVAKDRQGDINAFHNICRHRAYPVVEGEKGTARIFACRYHGWSYGLDGKMAKAPGYQDIPGFDKSQNGLFPIHVHLDVNGFIWINMDGKQKPEVAWEDDLEGVDTQQRLKQFNFDDYEYDHLWEIEAAYNWKIAADNYNECYHCKTTHPDIPTVADLSSYSVKTQLSWIQHNGATTAEQKARGLTVCATYYWPNASMNVS